MYANDYAVSEYKIPLTLERHLKSMAEYNDEIKDLESMWHLLKKQLEEQLTYSKSLFVNYSIHDASHSRSIIRSIERVLGENRIAALSPTDTFMILICAYAHDYGMALSYNRIYAILKSQQFLDFIEEKEKIRETLEKEDAKAIHALWLIKNNKKSHLNIQMVYRAINDALQVFLRPKHWRGVKEIENVFRGIFEGNVKTRFINGTEGIINMCMCHGMTMKDVLQLSFCADGMVSDNYHPRFVAEMLRLGDLLDLDNSRFPTWFVQEVTCNTKLIPELSVRHYYKHESITHLLITPDTIEITAQCGSKNVKHTAEDTVGRSVAGILSDWLLALEEECKSILLHWNEIAPAGFGRAPGKLKKKILVGKQEYNAEERQLQMKMSQERVMTLLQGTNIYRNKYVGIREMIQNAVDASLLQLWNDILENRYLSYGLSKDSVRNGFDFEHLTENDRYVIFGNYDIIVEIIKDYQQEKVFIVVKDKGIGIKPDEIKYIADLGSSKENNERVKHIQEKMPAWLQPSGVFGIGLQSVFQLTDCIDFYTRQPNELELNIRLTSSGHNRGLIDYVPVYTDDAGVYADNTVPGTNVKIEIDPDKLRKSQINSIDEGFKYYDPDFDDDNDELDIIFAEISSACTDIIKESRYDYFNIRQRNTIVNKEGDSTYLEKWLPKRKSYFFPRKKKEGSKEAPFGETFETVYTGKDSFPFSFDLRRAYYWDKDTKRAYCLTIRPCEIKENQIFFPKPVPNLYNISYKFNTISNIDSLYNLNRLHAGFVHMDVLILDDVPQKYLNIDRDRLREGAICEEELLAVRQKILVEWCKWFNLNNRSFKNELEILPSLFLVFYQNVEESVFEDFIDCYSKQIPANFYIAGDEKISFMDLLDSNKAFTTGSNSTEKIHVSTKTVMHLPHRLVYINEMRKDDEIGSLCYSFKLCGFNHETGGIDMDEDAKFKDYQNVLSYKRVKTKKGKYVKPNYHNLIKKLFKPDSDYPNLILDSYPHTFDKGENLHGDLNYIIERYILSPFDKTMGTHLNKLLTLHVDSSKKIAETNEFKEIVKQSMQTNQVKHCIRYVWKIRFNLQEGKEKTIAEDYNKFITEFIKILYKKREDLGYSTNESSQT